MVGLVKPEMDRHISKKFQKPEKKRTSKSKPFIDLTITKKKIIF